MAPIYTRQDVVVSSNTGDLSPGTGLGTVKLLKTTRFSSETTGYKKDEDQQNPSDRKLINKQNS